MVILGLDKKTAPEPVAKPLQGLDHGGVISMTVTTTVRDTTRKISTRELRALELYRTRGHEIRRVGQDLYLVPSCTGRGFYSVDYSEETCDCPDFLRRGENCKHLLAAGIHVAKRRARQVCACRGGWVSIGQLVLDPETGEETEEYALYLCRRCAGKEDA
jgi:predicted nucleic acid-binding Zn finger protein